MTQCQLSSSFEIKRESKKIDWNAREMIHNKRNHHRNMMEERQYHRIHQSSLIEISRQRMEIKKRWYWSTESPSSNRKKPLRTRGFFCIEMLNFNNYKQRIHFWIQFVYIKRIKNFKKKSWKSAYFLLNKRQFYFLQAKQWQKKKSKRRSLSINNGDSDWLFSLLFADCFQIQRRAIHEQKSQSSQSKTLFKKESTIWIHNTDLKEQSLELNLIQWFVEMIVQMQTLISILNQSQKIWALILSQDDKLWIYQNW